MYLSGGWKNMSCEDKKKSNKRLGCLLIVLVCVVAACVYFVVIPSASTTPAIITSLSMQGEKALLVDKVTYSHGVFLKNVDQRCFNGEVTFSYRWNWKEYNATVYDVVVRSEEVVYVKIPFLTSTQEDIGVKITSAKNNAPLIGTCWH